MIKLEINNIKKTFGGLKVLKGLTFKVEGPELLGLIGPNGAGKTTLVNILGGLIKPTSGTVYLNGRRIDPFPPYLIARSGIGRTFQVTRALNRMTVLENLYVPALAKNPGANKNDFKKSAMEILEFLTIEHLRDEYAKVLSGGQRKLLEMGRLFMLNPDIMILDEPFAGVHPRLREIIFQYIQRANGNGKGVIIISHDMDTIFKLSKRLLVLHNGYLIADDIPEVVKEQPAVIEAYLSKDEDGE